MFGFSHDVWSYTHNFFKIFQKSLCKNFDCMSNRKTHFENDTINKVFPKNMENGTQNY